MFRILRSSAFVFALALLTGCPALPKKAPERVTPLTGKTLLPPEEPEIPIAPSPTNLPPAAPKPAPAPAPTVLALKPPVPVVPREALNRWLFWDAWSRTNGLGAPQRVANAGALTYELRGANGSLAITAGNNLARWNGVNIELAHAPQFTNNRVLIHALDAMKNLQPLLGLERPSSPNAGRKIVIDPGHGGRNTGTQNANNGGFEKNYALDWALRLRPLLEAAGWKVFLTRTNDIELASSNRVALADQVAPDLFLSLHFNSVTLNGTGRNPNGHGIETYCLTPAGMASNLTRGFEDNRFLVYPNNAWDDENLRYAARIHQALIQETARRDRGVRRARFMTVLQGQNRPAVLIEGGYLSDPKEARLISSPAYRQKLAEAVAKALKE